MIEANWQCFVSGNLCSNFNSKKRKLFLHCIVTHIYEFEPSTLRQSNQTNTKHSLEILLGSLSADLATTMTRLLSPNCTLKCAPSVFPNTERCIANLEIDRELASFRLLARRFNNWFDTVAVTHQTYSIEYDFVVYVFSCNLLFNLSSKHCTGDVNTWKYASYTSTCRDKTIRKISDRMLILVACFP